jgi:hypothetical protein
MQITLIRGLHIREGGVSFLVNQGTSTQMDA